MKRAGIERDETREPMREPMRPRMKAAPNWTRDKTEFGAVDGVDKLRIDPSEVPQGMALQWVTSKVFGRPETQHRAGHEAAGWTPVHQEDFDGQFDGKWMPKGAEGEITMGGDSVLMARPEEMNDQAKLRDQQAAQDQVDRNRAFLTGDSATPGNRITRSMERIAIPEG